MRPLSRWRLCLVAVSVLLGSGASLYADELKKQQLSVGYIQSQIHGVNRLDAEAAFKALARTLGVISGWDVDIEVASFSDAAQFSTALGDKTINLIILDSWSYLEIDHLDAMEPVFVTSDHGKVTLRHLLLVRKEGAVKTLADLRGKSLNVITGQTSKLGRRWLNALLQSRLAASPEAFFSRLEYRDNPEATVLPVFFGKRKAALVDEAKFGLMVELNPQLNTLHAIASSEPLLNAVVCISWRGWSSETFKRDVVQALADLHRNPAGQQILTLFKTGQLVPFAPHYLDTVRQLHHRALPLAEAAPGAMAASEHGNRVKGAP